MFRSADQHRALKSTVNEATLYVLKSGRHPGSTMCLSFNPWPQQDDLVTGLNITDTNTDCLSSPRHYSSSGHNRIGLAEAV